MKIKDFKPGQTAYALVFYRRKVVDGAMKEDVEEVQERVVSRVGSKFVYCDKNYKKYEFRGQYAQCGSGYNSGDEKLFPSVQAIEDWREAVKLADKIREECSDYGLSRRYSLEQLRAVWAILADADA